MELRRRVEGLERAQGGRSEWCECPGNLRIIWDTDGPVLRHAAPVPDVCPKCGKPTRIIRVVWEDEAYWKGRPGIELA